jgi:uncharacterized membrane protein YuzA (DUF378 family)
MQKMLKCFHIIAITLVIIGGLNWGLVGGFKFDLVKWISSSLNLPILSRIIYSLVGLAALYLVLKRDVYLPFLNESVYPSSTLTDKVPEDATVKVTINVKPGAKVVYWASDSKKNPNQSVVSDPWTAYDAYENAGVATADAKGIAVLTVREPVKYAIPSGRVLSRHVHYRYVVRPGMLSRVETVNI